MTPSSDLQPAETASTEVSNPFAELVDLAHRHTSRHGYFAATLGVLGRTFASPYASLYIAEGSGVIEQEHTSDPAEAEFWRTGLNRFLTESLDRRQSRIGVFRRRQGEERVAFISAPFFDSAGAEIGSVALVQAPVDEERVRVDLALLESLTRLASALADQIGAPHEVGAAAAADASHLEAMRRGAGKASTPEELAFALTNTTRNTFGCEQVALGLVRGRTIKILSVSGLDNLASRNPGIQPLQAAMEECLDHGRPLVSQGGDAAEDDRPRSVHRLHRQWMTAARGDAVASLPLKVDGRILAILSLRRRAEQSITREDLEELRTRIEPFVPLLALSAKASRSLVRHLVDSVAALFRPRGAAAWRKRLAGVALAAGLAWFAFGSMDFRVSVPARVVAGQVRHVVMPVAGILVRADLKPGDRVHKGQVLCRVDDRELTEEKAGLEAEIKVLDLEADRAMADREPANVGVIRAKQRLLRTRIAILEARIAKTTVRAAIDGVVLSGEPGRKVGGVLPEGEPLVQLAPLDALVVELDIPERDVDEVRPGVTGHFIPYARPELRRDLQLTRIHPQAEAREGRTAYRSEATADLPPAWARPGMEGTAVLHAGRRAVWRVVLHRPLEYLRSRWLP